MIKISAKSIEDALLLASEKLECSCVDLEYEVLQYPSNGIFGMGRREARIVASIKVQKFDAAQKFDTQRFENPLANLTPKKPQRQSEKPLRHDMDSAIKEIEIEINELFSLLPFKLGKTEVSKYDQNTILIHFKGADSALLIGEKGYRYKAISYLLFNWINPKYGFNIRLEIEQFLATQEEMMTSYLEPIIQNIKDSKQEFISKPFDGILVYIALKKLRAHLPNRHIMVKTNENDETYIVVKSD